MEIERETPIVRGRRVASSKAETKWNKWYIHSFLVAKIIDRLVVI